MNRPFNITISLVLLFAFVFNFGCASTPQQNTTAAPSQSAPQQQVSQYWSGDGGKGMRLGILVPQGQGLAGAQDYLPAMVQGVLVANISKYSAINVLDRVSLDKVIAETEDLTYQDNSDIVRLGQVAQVGDMMTGKIIQTSTGYTLQINVTDTTNNAKTVAAYSGNCTVAELDNHMAIQKASIDLLAQMGVTLTAQARQELSGAAAENSIIAQTALAKGITAQKQGTEVAALSYYFQASTYDSSLAEALNRSSILEANISSGNIGNDVRNDIQWRKDWVARLTETEQYFSNFNQTQSMPYTLFYTNDIKQGSVDYQKETVAMSIDTYLHGSGIWTLSIERALQVVYDGLNSTGRKDTWGLGSWPQRGVTNQNTFSGQRQNFSVVFELLNNQGNVIGRQTLQTGGSWGLSWSGRPIINVNADNRQTLNFQNVNANDITDSLTIRVASVNGTDAETAAQSGVLQIRTLSKSEFDLNGSFRFSRGVIQGFANSRVENLLIPSTIWGEPVIWIGDGAFKGNGLNYVIIPDTVTTIGKEAFANSNLTAVKIGKGVTSIGARAFWENRFKRVTIPDGVKFIDEAAFQSSRVFEGPGPDGASNGIVSITIGENVNLIGNPFQYKHYVIKNGGQSAVDENEFQNTYIQNGMKAGTYSITDSLRTEEKWIYDLPGEYTNVNNSKKNFNNGKIALILGGSIVTLGIFIIFGHLHIGK